MNSNDRGFTLVELMISMVVGLVVLGATYAVFTVQSRYLTNQAQLASVYQNARIAIEMMCREISMSGYNQTTSSSITPMTRCTDALVAAGTPCVGITNASAAAISFTADLNGNGNATSDSTNPNENITYFVYSPSGGVQSLGRTSNGQTNPVVEYVEALSFAYEYEDGSVHLTPDLSLIRRVRITIRTRSATEDTNYTDQTYGDHYRRYTLTSYAIPRNLKY